MKKLLGSLLAVAAVALMFTACKNNEEPKFPTHLNTSDSRIGDLYGESGFVTDPADAQGILFAVSQDGATGYLVAFNDILSYDEVSPAETGMFGYIEVYSGPTAWSKLLYSTNANSSDGEENTNTIISVMEDSMYRVVWKDSTGVEHDSMAKRNTDLTTAARLCRDYYKRNITSKYVKKTDWDNEDNWPWAAKHKGKWYLPSMEELNALMKVRDKINARWCPGEKTDVMNEYGFIAIGGDMDYALWSSTEYSAKCAWYDLPASNNDNYLQKTFGNEGGLGKLFVRPIRKINLN